MKKQELPSFKFVVEPHDQGATVAIAYLVGDHYEVKRSFPVDHNEMMQVSRMWGRVLHHLLSETEKLRSDVDALFSMVVPMQVKRGRPPKGGKDGTESD